MKIISLCLAIFILSVLFVSLSPGCPFHVDYIQYVKSIENFYKNHVLDDGVNGKYIFVYLMAIFLAPIKYLGGNLYYGLVIVTAIFHALAIYLFYRLTNSFLKTAMAATTLTSLMFLGQPETVMLASVFLLLYFVNRDKPYSEFFIALASFIRLDYAIFYLFVRKKTAIIPIIITSLQFVAGRIYFVESDFGINQHIISTFFIFIASFGSYFLFLFFFRKVRSKLDSICLGLILCFIIFFLKFPTQKVFFFPVLIYFYVYDFEVKDLEKIVLVLLVLNVFMGLSMQALRSDVCTAQEFHEFAGRHKDAYFGVFEPYINETRLHYDYQITINCRNSTDYVVAEDWRNSQILFRPYRFCLEPWDGRYG